MALKVASLREGGRDGTLVVVDETLERAVRTPQIAQTLQQALEDWAAAAPALESVYRLLNDGMAKDVFTFDPGLCAAPLPRAYQWLDGSAYVHHVELVRKARGAELPHSFWTDPLMYQGASDRFLGPTEPIEAISEDHGIDCEAEVAVVVDDVPMAVSPMATHAHVKLLMLVNDVSLRGLIPPELSKGFGFLHGKPLTAFSPVAQK